jgi:hypothetical protein
LGFAIRTTSDVPCAWTSGGSTSAAKAIMMRAIEVESEPYDRFFTTRITASLNGMSSATLWNLASERSSTKRGGSAIENVVKFGGLEPVIVSTTDEPASFTSTAEITFRS